MSPSQSNLLPNWAKSSGSSPNSRLSKRKSFRSEAQALFEYGPQSGPATTWPHFEWERLVALLNSEETQVEHQIAMDDPLETEPSAVQAATYRVKDDDDKVMRESLMSLEDAANLFHSVRNMSPDADADAHAPMLPSVIHTIPLSQYMHLVVIVKGEEEEEQRWHRRRLKPLSDFEIRAFLQEMAGKLRVSEIFGRTPEVDMEIPLAIEDLIVTGSSDPNEKKSMLTDEEAKSLLRSIKEAFGLRPVSPLRTDSLRGKSPNLSRRRQSSRRSSRSKTEKPQLDKSAAAFFLGSALADVI